MNSHEAEMLGHYDVRLVALSVVIAVVASYAALNFAARITNARGRMRYFWLGGGATAMGIGIWSMHYIGMLAFQLPVPVQYDWPTVLYSLLAAIFASLVALFVVSRKKMGLLQALAGCAVMGGGIAAMHYIGMAAMRLPAMGSYSPMIVTLSVILAFVISFVALWLTFYFRGDTTSWGWRKIVSALVMGAAIPVMHYTGMAAARFTPSASGRGSITHALNISSLGVASVIIVTFMVLGLSILTSFVDRRFSAKALELETSERRYHHILESAIDAFVGMDSSGRITDWNAQAERSFGWPRTETMGRLLSEIIVPKRHRAAHEMGLRHYLATGEGPVMNKRIEIDALHRDGHEFPVELAISAISAGGGGVQRFAAFVRDITESKRSKQELLAAKRAAEQSNEAKSTFLATMSHEIRTPMNGILGMTELVLDSELTSEQRENLGLVRLSAESLLSIINDILDFSKIEAGKLEVESIPFDLRESLGEAMKALSVRADQKGLELIYDVEPTVPEALVGDPGRIRQILINMIGNAIKFTSQGEIFVHVEEEFQGALTTTLHFAIKDTGVGVPADKQEIIFEAFSQVDGSMARKYGGTGLGLAICVNLAKMMHGRVWVESQLGQGSTFHFTAQLGVQNTPLARPQPLQPDQLRNLPVLIVDDNFTNRRVLHGMLDRWGMRPTAVEGGRQALQALEIARCTGHSFPLILLDGQMPDMDGFALADEILRSPDLVGAAIMMLTSAGHLGDAARCRELGISAYLVKPIRQGELLDAICLTLNELSEKENQKPILPLITKHSLQADRHRLYVLLAEDNVVNQTLAMRLLEKRGYRVALARNGRVAVEHFDKERFDAILMDLQMPEMDGFEATAAIRVREKTAGGHIPIIAMTAHALKGDQDRCLAAGMDGYISKPIRTSEMFALIERLTGKGKDGLQEVDATINEIVAGPPVTSAKLG